MARPSQITTEQIDEINGVDATFPVAGVDNSTQGFRDNFSNIKSSIAMLKTRVNELIENAIVKEDETYVYNTITNNSFFVNSSPLVLSDSTQTLDAGNYAIDASLGSYQKLELAGNTAITDVINWPEYTFENTAVFSGYVSTITVAVVKDPQINDSSAPTLSWPSGTNKAVANLKYRYGLQTDITVADGETHFFKIWSATAGAGEIFVEYLGVYQ